MNQERRAKWWKGRKERTGSMMISSPDNSFSWAPQWPSSSLHICTAHPSFLVMQRFQVGTWHLGTGAFLNLLQSMHWLVCAASNWHCWKWKQTRFKVRKRKTWTHGSFKRRVTEVCDMSLLFARQSSLNGQCLLLPAHKQKRWQWQLQLSLIDQTTLSWHYSSN